MSREKALEVCKQIREALAVKKLQYRECFDKFDLDNDGLVSYAEFQRGLDQVIKLSQPIKEQLYALMDKNNIGLISYDQFLEVLRLENIEKKTIEDNFDWESGVIDKLKQWIVSQNLTVEEAFKCFDKDFDGFVSKADLRASLLDILEIDAASVLPTKLDRLFRLMDFFKSGQVQVSDFQRLISNSNPYSDTRVSGMTKSMSRSLGGGLTSTSTFDWKFSAIQQIGLVISRKYPSLNDSFNKASENSAKIQFNKFKTFLDSE
jgi:Ca2+-binding EF-hand superfamily protein